MSAANRRLLSLGSVNLDLQVRAERWPEPGETMPARDLIRGLGGKAANRACAAARLGARAALFGRVGVDDDGDAVLRRLQAAGVDLRQVRAIPGEVTGLAFVVVRADGDKTIINVPGANHAWSRDDAAAIREVLDAEAPGSALTLDLEATPALVLAAAQAARERGLIVVLDPSPAGRVTDELLGLADAVTPNPAEAAALTGVTVDGAEAARRAGQALRERGARAAFVKLRRGGCVYVGADAHARSPALAVEVVDTTGAGDAFAAALAVALMEDLEPGRAAGLASVAASLAVGAYGAQAGYAGRPRLELALAELQHQR